jgi:hypothetical protein
MIVQAVWVMIKSFQQQRLSLRGMAYQWSIDRNTMQRVRLSTTIPHLYLLRGHAIFKDRLAWFVEIEPQQLPYREQVVEFLQWEQARERLSIATAAYRRIAEAVARHLGIFDGVSARDGAYNQKEVFKLTAIGDADPSMPADPGPA